MLDKAENWLQANDPNYLKARQGWKHLTRLDRKCNLQSQKPYEEIPVAQVADDDDEAFEDEYGRSFENPLEAAIEQHGVLWFDYEAEREKKPHRKKDRHKGSRAAYMREYRARKKAAEADGA